MRNKRDDFNPRIKETIAKRASYICSNPVCRVLTLCPSEINSDKYIYIGKVAHITAAASNGPRYDPSLTTEQRASIKNGIFLCSNCAEMIDKNNGLDFSKEQVKSWKTDHENWVRNNLNKRGLLTYDQIFEKQQQAIERIWKKFNELKCLIVPRIQLGFKHWREKFYDQTIKMINEFRLEIDNSQIILNKNIIDGFRKLDEFLYLYIEDETQRPSEFVEKFEELLSYLTKQINSMKGRNNKNSIKLRT